MNLLKKITLLAFAVCVAGTMNLSAQGPSPKLNGKGNGGAASGAQQQGQPVVPQSPAATSGQAAGAPADQLPQLAAPEIVLADQQKFGQVLQLKDDAQDPKDSLKLGDNPEGKIKEVAEGFDYPIDYLTFVLRLFKNIKDKQAETLLRLAALTGVQGAAIAGIQPIQDASLEDNLKNLVAQLQNAQNKEDAAGIELKKDNQPVPSDYIIEMLGKQIEADKAALAAEIAARAAAATEKANLQGELAAAKADAGQQVTELQKRLQGATAAANSERADLNSRLVAAAKAQEDARIAAEQAAAEKQQLQDALAEAQRKATAQEQEIGRLTADLNTANGELTAAKKTIADMKAVSLDKIQKRLALFDTLIGKGPKMPGLSSAAAPSAPAAGLGQQ